MQVENIECQIAKAQIGHYLAGAGLSDEAMAQLEEHIKECPECKAALATRRQELLTLLKGGEAKPAEKPVEFKMPTGTPRTFGEAIQRRQIQEQYGLAPKAVIETEDEIVQEPAPKPKAKQIRREVPQPQVQEDSTAKGKSNIKPLLYSLALAAVLVGMSFVAKDPTSLFGDRVMGPTTTVTQAPPVTENPTEEPAAPVDSRADIDATATLPIAGWTGGDTDPKPEGAEDQMQTPVDPKANGASSESAPNEPVKTDANNAKAAAAQIPAGTAPTGKPETPASKPADQPKAAATQPTAPIKKPAVSKPAVTIKKAPAKSTVRASSKRRITNTRRSNTRRVVRKRPVTRRSSGGSGIRVYAPGG